MSQISSYIMDRIPACRKAAHEATIISNRSFSDYDVSSYVELRQNLDNDISSIFKSATNYLKLGVVFIAVGFTASVLSNAGFLVVSAVGVLAIIKSGINQSKATNMKDSIVREVLQKACSGVIEWREFRALLSVEERQKIVDIKNDPDYICDFLERI